MQNVIGVECWADKYFFSKLLNNENLIRKEKNKNAVIKGVDKAKNKLCIGIIDDDNDKNIGKKLLSNYSVIATSSYTAVYKSNIEFHFVFILSPRQFEHWLGEFLNVYDIKIQAFGYQTFNEFLEESKTLNPQNYLKFKAVIDFVLQEYESTENHILKIKNQINYILDKNFNFNEIEFQNV